MQCTCTEEIDCAETKAKLWISKINAHLLISVVSFSFIEAQELIFLHRRDHNWWPGSTVYLCVHPCTSTQRLCSVLTGHKQQFTRCKYAKNSSYVNL